MKSAGRRPRFRPAHRPLCASLALVASLSCAGRAHAVEDLFTPRAEGVGEALRADAQGALGPTLNPSGMSLARAYSIEAAYGFDFRSLGSNLHLSIVDSATSKLAVGIYYDYVHSQPRFAIPGIGDANITRSGSETGIALAVALGSWFNVGATLKYLHIATTAVNPAYDAVTNPLAPQTLQLDSTTSTAAADGFTLDAGITLKLGEKFNLAAVGYNLIPLHSFDAPIALGLGFALKPVTGLTIAFDTVIDFDKYAKVIDAAGDLKKLTTVRLGGGLEYMAGKKVPLRAGAVWDNGRPGGFLTCGLGYSGTSFGIDLSYRQQITNGIESRLVLGLRVLLPQ